MVGILRNAVDLFSGAGGLSAAAIKANLKVVFAIEADKHSVKTYEDNLNRRQGYNIAIYNSKIETLNAADTCERHFNQQDCDIVLGGPPCQGFSSLRGKKSGVNDERNALIFTYFDYVKRLRPKLFLMENVPGMLTAKHRDYVAKFYETAEEAGYKLAEPVVVDARDFGVPQRRKRVFVLGVRSDLNAENLQWPPEPTHSSEDSEKLPWVNCSHVFDPAPPNDPNNIHMNHSDALVTAFRNTPINGGSRRDSGRVLPCHQNRRGFSDVYGRINPNEPGPTMTTACINPSKGRFVHPTQHHGITVRQAARMQTFPDSWVFSGGLIASGRQIGNAVPVSLGTALLKHLNRWLEAISSN